MRPRWYGTGTPCNVPQGCAPTASPHTLHRSVLVPRARARARQASREQLAIAEFAQAMLVIPKTLANNAAKDATDLVATLRAYHNAAQTDPAKSHLRWCGRAHVRPPAAAPPRGRPLTAFALWRTERKGEVGLPGWAWTW